MTTTTTASINTPTLKHFRVVVIEWLTHNAIIEAADASVAEAEARRLWATNAEHQLFSFDNSGIDGIEVEEVEP